MTQGIGFWRRAAPAVSLALLAPLCAEVLPGATRFGSLFVFPIEAAVWGGATVLIREIVRRRGLGWPALLLLGLALSLAEEFLIQQTSAAPLVIMLKHQVYARAGGVNYLYLAWALLYEPVMVVLVPVALTELLFPARRLDPWLNRAGFALVLVLLLVGSVLAWFTWTHIARVQVFHLPPYTPPPAIIGAASLVIIGLFAIAMRTRGDGRATMPGRSAVLIGAGATWSILLFGVLLMAFGIAPAVTPALPLAGAGLLALVPLAVARRRTPSEGQTMALILGVMSGSMAVSFVGFIGATTADLLFKIIVDLAAFAWFVMLLLRRRHIATWATSSADRAGGAATRSHGTARSNGAAGRSSAL
jgi:hypothetical protein